VGSGLQNELDELKAARGPALPARVRQVNATAQQQAEQTAERDKFARVGTTIAEFTLPDANGGQTSLSRLLGEGPAVLVFYRGAWCPYCNLTLRAYQRDLLPELQRRGVRLAAISPQVPDGSLSTMQTNELDYAVLSDVGSVVARGLGISFRPGEDVREVMSEFGIDLGERNGTGEWELPYPAVLVVDTDRTIRFIDVHPDYSTRTEPAQVLAALDARSGQGHR
jgi:peroxiredoxin